MIETNSKCLKTVDQVLGIIHSAPSITSLARYIVIRLGNAMDLLFYLTVLGAVDCQVAALPAVTVISVGARAAGPHLALPGGGCDGCM